MRHRFFCGLMSLLVTAAWPGASQAALIVGFEFAGGGNTMVVPATGGTYTINIVASTTNPLTTNLGVSSGYLGALSQVLNGSVIGGNIVARSLIPGLGTNLGPLVDRNADSRIDLGWVNGQAKTVPEWMRPATGSAATVLFGAPTGILGTFDVTIPANTATGTNFLSYLPQVDPGGLGSDWGWTETGAANAELSGAATAGTSITFASAAPIPEPGTIALGGVLLAGLAGWRVRRK